MEMIQLKVPEWDEYKGLLHGFMGRRGGKSVGRYAGLNVSYRVGDDAKLSVKTLKHDPASASRRQELYRRRVPATISRSERHNLQEAGEAAA